MNISGRRILKTTATVVGLGALGALGSGTAFAATSADLGGAPTSHGAGAVDEAGLSSPTSAKSGEPHSFAMPKMATHIDEPSSRYDDNNYDNNYDNNADSSDYRDNNRYNDNNNYDNNYDNGYYNNDNGYDNGYRNHDGGLFGGGLLGGNN